MSSRLVLLLLCLCTSSSGQECREELLENVDFPGADIESVFSPDVQHCQLMCTQHPSCRFFSFIRPDWTRGESGVFQCCLKRTESGEPALQTPLFGVTSGFSLRHCRHHSACITQIYSNVDFNGADYRALFTADYSECQRVCTDEPSCQFFTWTNGLFSNDKIRYKCHLKFSWTVPLIPNVHRQSGVVSGFSPKLSIRTSHRFAEACPKTYFSGLDIYKNDIMTTPAVSADHCHLLCADHPSCTYFSHRDTTCFLKNNPNEMQFIAQRGVTSGMPSRKCEQDRSWLSAVHEGLDLRGSVVSFVIVDDVQSCQTNCSRNAECQFFSFVTENFHEQEHRGRCFLKRGVTVPAPPRVMRRANVVSGFALRNCGSA